MSATDHRDPFNRPDIGGVDEAKWCGVCGHWDNDLVADGNIYRHAQDVMVLLRRQPDAPLN